MTLLSYVPFTSPDPLQVGGTNARLMLAVSNPGHQPVTVQSLVVTVPVGTAAKDLTGDATGVQVLAPDGWSAVKAGGTITLTPRDPAVPIGAGGLVFTFAAITVNGQPGLCAITVDETASTQVQPPAERTALIGVAKFPAQFYLSPLTADPIDVLSGGSTTLMWDGAPATYALDYQPANDGPPVHQSVGNVGPFQAHGLTRGNSVVFTLTAFIPVPGLDHPLTVRRQATVTVETPSLAFEVIPTVVGVNGLVQLTWEAANAARCMLDDGTVLPERGVRWMVLAQSRTFTLTTYDAAGNVLRQAQVAVAVNPSIRPTEAGYTITGPNGADGADGISVGEGGGRHSWDQPTSGRPGERGGDAVLRGAMPPLDPTSAPRRVIPIALRGGSGGQGGIGGVRTSVLGEVIRQMSSGSGGNGGDAVIDATFDPSAAPAQYVVTLAPGAGGPGAQDGRSRPGSPGSTSITFRRPALRTGRTLLSYALLTAPSPLQAGTDATLTLVVSNPSSRFVRADAIVVSLPVGTNAKALVADASGIEVVVPEGWSSARDGGELRLTPRSDEAKRIGPAGLVFVLAAVRVNDEPGTTRVTIDETAALEGGTPTELATDLPLSKFPRQFQVSELRADRLAVDAGGTVELQWAGTPATYRIQYSPGDGPPVDVPVGATGPYPSQPLHRTPNVVFTLVVSVAVPGQDHPLVLQRQLAVDVRAVTIHRFDVLPAFIPANGVAQLTWRTSNAASVVIQPGNRTVEPNGSLYLYLPAAPADPFTLIAVDGAGSTVSQQRTIRTDPSLQVNAERFDFSGKPGKKGAPSGIGPGASMDAEAGGPGDPGASVTVRVGPLDLTGTSGRVRGAFARGGDGGQGGQGLLAFPGGPGGDGGPGGHLTLQFAAQAGPPGQLVVDVSGGRGGPGGDPGLFPPRGNPGAPGPAGRVTLEDARVLRNAPARRIAPAPAGTLLGYGLLEEPGDDGTTVMTLSLSGPVAEVETITVPLPLLSRPDGWTAVEDDGGATTLTPPATLAPGGATFTFMPVSGRPPSLEVRETAGGRTRTALFTLDQPAQ